MSGSVFEPEVLHSVFMVAHSEMAGGEQVLLDMVKERMAHAMADKIGQALGDAPGGMILSPLTFTINDDGEIGAARVAGTINATRLPDPSEGLFYLYDGRMHGRSIRVGTPAPEFYRIPWVPPVSAIQQGPGLMLEYRRIPDTTAYGFVREWLMPG